MKKIKMLALTTVIGTSFIAGQVFAPTASVAEPGSIDDPAISESLFNQELGKLKTEITSLKSTINTLENEVKKLSSNSGGTTSGGTTSGGTTSGGTTSGGTTSGGTTTTTKTGTVNAASGLNVRSGAGTNYSLVGVLKNGTTVTILQTSGSWYQIKSGTLTGWVSSSYVKTTTSSGSTSGSTTTTKTGVVNAASGLNVRSGAGTNYSLVGALKNGTTVTILQTSGSWYQIKSGTLTGWASSSYIKVS